MLAARAHICFVAPTSYPVLSGDRDCTSSAAPRCSRALIATALAARGWRVSMISMNYGQREGEVIDGVRLLTMHAPDAGVPVLRYLHPRLTACGGRCTCRCRRVLPAHLRRPTGFVAAFARRHGRVSLFAGAHDADFEPGLPLIRYARDRAVYRWACDASTGSSCRPSGSSGCAATPSAASAVRIHSCYAHRGRPAAHGG